MSFITEAELLLSKARDADQPRQLGLLVMAKDTVAAAISECKSGVKNRQGELIAQSTLEDFTGDGEPAPVDDGKRRRITKSELREMEGAPA